MAPFMMYNVAYFMLPPAALPAGGPAEMVSEPAPHLRRGMGHRIAGGLLRLLALAATVQFASAAMAVTVSTVAWQAAGRTGMLPSWMGWYGAWTAGWRVADRKSTRLNSSHLVISYAVFCLKKKNITRA